MKFNHDVNPHWDSAQRYQLIGGLLKRDELIEAFDKEDVKSKLAKAAFLRNGHWALALGTIALLAIVGEVLAAGLGSHAPMFVTAAIELCALVAFVLLLWTRLRGWRRRWVEACFKRERIRHWQFQLFLDGKFVEQFANNPQAAEPELSRRWDELTQNLANETGALGVFLKHPYRLFHPVTAYRNAAVRTEVHRALAELRFDHQVQYIEPTGGDDSALREHHHIAETIAAVSLALAVATPLAQLLVLLLCGLSCLTEQAMGQWQVSLFCAALVFVIISAAARAYRSGMTLPEEIESYGSYLHRVYELRAVFLHEKSSWAQRFEAHVELERQAAVELRRFLAMKRKATFVF